MPERRPRLLLVKGSKVPTEHLAHVLGEEFEVMSIDATGLRALSPRGVFGASSQGYDLVVAESDLISSGATRAAPNGGAGGQSELPEIEAAATLAAIGEGVCICSMEGALVWANERFRAFDDQTRARITAVCRRAAAQYEEQILRQEAAGYSFGSQKFNVASPDESRFYEVVVSPVRSHTDGPGPGRIERVAAVVWDVTHSKRVAQKMDAIDRAGAELVRLDAESVRKKHAHERLKVMEEKIIKYSHELMHFDHLAIRLVDERTGKLELVMASGLPPEAMEVELYAQKEGNGIMGYVAATGRSYLCPDIQKDRRYVMGLHDARSSLTVPLRLNDKVIGAFNVESERLAGFTEEDRQFAEIFSNHIALALHILDLLVVQRAATGETVSVSVQGEIREPLEDIVEHAEWLRNAATQDTALRSHVDRILSDCAAIREKVREAAAGPQHIIGAERALAEMVVDPQISGRHVLVADDEPKIRQTIRDILRGRGARVTVCSNGQAAIDELEASVKRPTGRFDLIVSDIKMPDKNGYEVFAAARRVDVTIPVILMTGFGYDPHHSIVRASQEGLRCVLFKPFAIEKLIDEVRKALVAPVKAGSAG